MVKKATNQVGDRSTGTLEGSEKEERLKSRARASDPRGNDVMMDDDLDKDTCTCKDQQGVQLYSFTLITYHCLLFELVSGIDPFMAIWRLAFTVCTYGWNLPPCLPVLLAPFPFSPFSSHSNQDRGSEHVARCPLPVATYQTT